MADVRVVRVGVVLYRNSAEDVGRLVRSLESARSEQDTPEFELAWIDNSPTTELAQAFGALGLSGYRSAGANLGFGAGHNQLMAEAFASPEVDAYLCLNPDAVLHPRCLAELVLEARRHVRPGLVEALQFPDEHPKRYDPRTHETPWCSGCVLLVTRALYQAIGGFDESFFMYCEDVDLSWRARASGFQIAVAPRALAHHYTGDREPGGFVAREMFRSGAYLGAKYGSEAFTKKCLAEFRSLSGEDASFPPVAPPSAAMRKTADFDHLFHFAEARW